MRSERGRLPSPGGSQFRCEDGVPAEYEHSLTVLRWLDQWKGAPTLLRLGFCASNDLVWLEQLEHLSLSVLMTSSGGSLRRNLPRSGLAMREAEADRDRWSAEIVKGGKRK